ncbi:hypothetical protein XENOCAPTIV_028869, partial [Xenoophorus captivus]
KLASFWKNAFDWLDQGRKGVVGFEPGVKPLPGLGLTCKTTEFREDLSVFVCTAYSDNNAETIQRFVVEGGGLLIGFQTSNKLELCLPKIQIGCQSDELCLEELWRAPHVIKRFPITSERMQGFRCVLSGDRGSGLPNRMPQSFHFHPNQWFYRTALIHSYHELLQFQLQKKFGWAAFKRVFANYQNMSNYPRDNDGKMNLYAETFSKAVNMNLTGFFKAWGWPIKQATEEKLSNLPHWTDHPMAQYS